ncbi:MAG: 2-phospho-L-lactate transferase [Nitrososphaerota archaeon]|nr:2-phospho-L-lactate transferase [Nitrososphaerota archaeon]
MVALAGGTGSAKLIRGLQRLEVDLTVVANVGDNAWVYGAYVCPDVDIACYTVAGVADASRGWGLEGDTFRFLEAASKLGVETWFRLGDRDLATCLARTDMLRRGLTLTEATDKIRRALGAEPRVLPACDEPVRTTVSTPKGDLGLQEFWVRDRGRPRVHRVSYRGARSARPTRQVADAVKRADRVVMCPANPITSIGPMLAVPGFREALSSSRRVVAVSPLIGSAPFSGPAGKLMRATGKRPDSLGVARLYAGVAGSLLVSDADAGLKPRIEALGVECRLGETRMAGPEGEARLAREVLEA